MKINFLITYKSAYRIATFCSSLTIFIMLLSKYNNSNSISFILTLAFVIVLYGIGETSENMSNEQICLDNRTYEEIEEDRIKNRINLLEAAKDQFLLNAINNGVNLNAYKDASDKIDYEIEKLKQQPLLLNSGKHNNYV